LGGCLVDWLGCLWVLQLGDIPTRYVTCVGSCVISRTQRQQPADGLVGEWSQSPVDGHPKSVSHNRKGPRYRIDTSAAWWRVWVACLFPISPLADGGARQCTRCGRRGHEWLTV
jgi:hypothetical protein